MKRYIPSVFLLMISNCFADELHNYNETKLAVITGKTIHITIDFEKCATTNKKISRSMIVGVFTPNEIQIVNDNIATSFMHFTLNNPAFPGKAVYEFVRYTITGNNDVNLTAQALDATNYKPVSDTISFNCKIESGARIYT